METVVGMSMPNSHSGVLKMGWLEKKGEFIKQWRRRFLVLYNDGTLNGYKRQPSPQDIAASSGNLENAFNVKNSQIIRTDECYFKIRCRQQNPTKASTFIERSFRADTQQDRNEWSDKIEMIYKRDQQQRRCSDLMDIDLSNEIDMDKFCHPEIQRVSRRLTTDCFEKIKVLGKGTFGQVYLVYKKTDEEKKRMALKTIPKSLIKEREESEHMKSERQVLTLIDHPFLIKLYHAFQSASHLCFVMEFARGGEIYNHLSKSQTFSIQRCRLYGAEIISAFAYLHDRNIIYRDLKLENLLLDEDGHIKITDFGLCKILNTPDRSTKTFCGTPEYLAPEVLDEDRYGLSVDWWSLGVVLHEMIVGKLPFYNSNQDELFDAICNNELPEIPQRVPEDATDMLKRLLIKQPALRLGSGTDDAKEVMRHRFFSEIDWQKLERRELKPQFVPNLTGLDDLNGFDPTFTSQPVHSGYTYTENDEFPSEENEFSDFSYNAKSHQDQVLMA